MLDMYINFPSKVKSYVMSMLDQINSNATRKSNPHLCMYKYIFYPNN